MFGLECNLYKVLICVVCACEKKKKKLYSPNEIKSFIQTREIKVRKILDLQNIAHGL